MSNQPPRKSPHFFDREDDGSVRLRLRFSSEEASKYEEAAGETPLLAWIHQTLGATADRQIAQARRNRPKVRPE